MSRAGGARRGAVWQVERAIVMQLLRDDRPRRWTVADLAETLSNVDRALVDRAVARLEEDGLLERSSAEAWASRAALRLDELELVGI